MDLVHTIFGFSLDLGGYRVYRKGNGMKFKKFMYKVKDKVLKNCL